MHTIVTILLFFSGAGIFWQDLRTRLISLWLIVVFAACNACFCLAAHSFSNLIVNAVFCISYVTVVYLALLLYLYVKHKKRTKLINTQLGLGDVLILLAIGLSLEPEILTFFFSAALLSSLLISLLFFRKQSIPLAGLLIANYLVFLVSAQWLASV